MYRFVILSLDMINKSVSCFRLLESLLCKERSDEDGLVLVDAVILKIKYKNVYVENQTKINEVYAKCSSQ
jgi:hypothetical protein